jgi:hypothetical protein
MNKSSAAAARARTAAEARKDNRTMLDALDSPALIERFEGYFKHPDAGHHGLQQGERAVAVKNVKAALAWLGLARVFGQEPDLLMTS